MKRRLVVPTVTTTLLIGLVVAPATQAYEVEFGRGYCEVITTQEDLDRNFHSLITAPELAIVLLKEELPAVADSIDAYYEYRQTDQNWPPRDYSVMEHYREIEDAANERFGFYFNPAEPDQWASTVGILNWAANKRGVASANLNYPSRPVGDVARYETDDIAWMVNVPEPTYPEMYRKKPTIEGTGPYLNIGIQIYDAVKSSYLESSGVEYNTIQDCLEYLRAGDNNSDDKGGERPGVLKPVQSSSFGSS